jgi:Holliday junction resolvase RusA-like endonuclease
MEQIQIVPLSVNKCYRGRRFATKELLAYKTELAYRLPKMTIPKGKLSVRYIFGVSSKRADADNLVKCLQDSLAKKYGFDDRMIYEITVEKVDVPKGKEYVAFEINPFGAEIRGLEKRTETA